MTTDDETKSPQQRQATPPATSEEMSPPQSPPVVESSSQDDDSDRSAKSKAESGMSNAMRTRKQKSDRIARLTFAELQPYFTMPLYEAAAQLQICGTVLKRISRRCGIPTWPFRQIRDLNSRIDSLKGLMETAHGKKYDAMALELSQLQQTRDYILESGQVAEYRPKPTQSKKEAAEQRSRDPMHSGYEGSSADRHRRDVDAPGLGLYHRPRPMYPGAALTDTAYLQDLAYRGLDYRGVPMGPYGDLAHSTASAPPPAAAMAPGYHHRHMFGVPWFPYLSQQLSAQTIPDARGPYPVVSPQHVDARFDPLLMSADLRHLSGHKRTLDQLPSSYTGAPANIAAGFGSAGISFDAMPLHHRSIGAHPLHSRYHAVEDSDSPPLEGSDATDVRAAKRNKWSSGHDYPNANWQALMSSTSVTAVDGRI